MREGTVVWGFVSAAAIVLLLTPAVTWLAPRVGAVDDPTRSDRPRVHQRPLPRIGGVAIVLGILVPGAILLRPGCAFLDQGRTW